VSVATTVVERSIVARALGEARRLGFAVRAVEIEAAEPRAKPDLLPLPELRTRSFGQFALTGAAALLVAVLAAAAALYPFVREGARADALQQSLAAVRVKAEAVQRLEKGIESERAAANFLVDRKRTAPMAVDLLAELTRIAPDDTWLSSAQYTGNQIQITGLSRSASALIGRFEQSKIFANAQFRSPVTPDQASGDEHFVISADVAAAGAPQ
jgi:general secretion pathway protein L